MAGMAAEGAPVAEGVGTKDRENQVPKEPAGSSGDSLGRRISTTQDETLSARPPGLR